MKCINKKGDNETYELESMQKVTEEKSMKTK